MKISEFRKLIREEVRKVIKEEKFKPGFRGVDRNDYLLTVVDGPYMSVVDFSSAIKTKYKNAIDILRDRDLMDELNDTNASEVGGFYLVKSRGTGNDPKYGGTGYSIINGEDITAN